MQKFDFKSYHIRAMNAANESEKLLINQELKDFYANLDENSQIIFNEELQKFLVSEYSKIKSIYDGANGSGLN